jgi:hypothetical protein
LSDPVRDTMLVALEAARGGKAPAAIADAVIAGDRAMRLEQLNFDSLAWMEFCISVELQTGQELTPTDVESMHYVFEIEEWLRARV